MAQREREQLQRPPLQLRREVDEHVPAQREVDARERRAARQVVLAEDGEQPDRLADLVALVGGDEMPLDQIRRDAIQRRRRIDPAAREEDRVVVEVRREDPDGPLRQLVAEGIRDEDRERIRLLARGTAGRPDAELAPAGARVGDHGRDHDVAQVVEQLRVAEELRDLDQEVAHEPAVLVGVPVHVAHVVAQAGRVGRRHPALQPAQDRRSLVGAEVDAALLSQVLEEGVQQPLVVGSVGRESPGHELVQELAETLEPHHDVDARRRQRRRQRGERRRVGILDHDRAATRLDMPGTDDAI